MTTKVQSLSFQKVKRKVSKNVRNVLAIPIEEYWPLLPPGDSDVLTSVLKKSLKFARVNKPRPPWRELQSLSREERKKRENELFEEQPINVQMELREAMKNRNNLLLGVNSVTKGIEEGLINCCIVAEDANPQLLVKHIITLAKHMNIPIVVVPSLKEITKEVLGFSCLALGFKNIIMEDKTNIFYQTCITVTEISQNFTLKHDIPAVNDGKTWFPFDMVEDKSTINNEEKLMTVEQKSWYLYRDSDNYRVFTKRNAEELKKEETFISLYLDNNNIDNKKPIPSKTIYLSNEQPVEMCGEESDGDHSSLDDFIAVDTSPFVNEDNKNKNRPPKFHPAKILRTKSNPNKFKKCKPQKVIKGFPKK